MLEVHSQTGCWAYHAWLITPRLSTCECMCFEVLHLKCVVNNIDHRVGVSFKDLDDGLLPARKPHWLGCGPIIFPSFSHGDSSSFIFGLLSKHLAHVQFCLWLQVYQAATYKADSSGRGAIFGVTSCRVNSAAWLWDCRARVASMDRQNDICLRLISLLLAASCSTRSCVCAGRSLSPIIGLIQHEGSCYLWHWLYH